MAAVRLFHWKSAEAGALIAKLRSAGYEVLYRRETQSPSVREIRDAAPVAIAIDLSHMPSHGRYVAAWVRGSKSIRHIPIVFVDGDAAKVDAIRREIPDAVYTTQARLVAALKRVKPAKDPIVPKQMMETDPSRTAAQKLGIREGAVVGLIDPPADYKKVLGKLPVGVVLEEDPDRACAVTLWFVRDPGEYEAALPARRVLAARSRLWILWPKGRRDGLNGNFVRQGALAMGLVDYKICSVDGAWSGMVFAVKKARG
jgi:hypothetical protein